MSQDCPAIGEPPPASPQWAPARSRLIPALNPCWRLWLREEGPLELVCLAQMGLELWSVQTDGLNFYFCHDRMVRRVQDGCNAGLRRDIQAVRAGFVREVRLFLSEAVPSQAAFSRDRDRASRMLDAAASDVSGPGADTAPTRVDPGVNGAAPEPAARPPVAVQVSYRRRRHVPGGMRDALA